MGTLDRLLFLVHRHRLQCTPAHSRTKMLILSLHRSRTAPNSLLPVVALPRRPRLAPHQALERGTACVQPLETYCLRSALTRALWSGGGVCAFLLHELGRSIAAGRRGATATRPRPHRFPYKTETCLLGALAPRSVRSFTYLRLRSDPPCPGRGDRALADVYLCSAPAHTVSQDARTSLECAMRHISMPARHLKAGFGTPGRGSAVAEVGLRCLSLIQCTTTHR